VMVGWVLLSVRTSPTRVGQEKLMLLAQHDGRMGSPLSSYEPDSGRAGEAHDTGTTPR
jgi:hypothetical protein